MTSIPKNAGISNGRALNAGAGACSGGNVLPEGQASPPLARWQAPPQRTNRSTVPKPDERSAPGNEELSGRCAVPSPNGHAPMPHELQVPQLRGIPEGLNAPRDDMSEEMRHALIEKIQLCQRTGTLDPDQMRASEARKFHSLTTKYDTAAANFDKTMTIGRAAFHLLSLSTTRNHEKSTSMHPLIPKLDAQRNKIRTQMDEILRTAQAGQRSALTDAETAAFRDLEADVDALGKRIEQINDDEQRAADIHAAFAAIGLRADGGEDEFSTRIREAALTRSLTPIDVHFEGRSGYSPGIERRDLMTTSGGGMTGTTFYNQLVRHLVEGSAVLAAGAHLVTTDSGEPLVIPKTTADSAAAILTEGSAIGESDPTLGRATLGAFKYAFLVQITREFAEDASFDVAGYLAQQAGQALANAFGAHAINGTGTGEPSGIVPNATAGVTGGTGVAGAFTADNIIDLYHSVAEPYARSAGAAWLMRNTTLAAVRKLKAAGTGSYLFNLDVPANYPGAAGMLLGRPVYVDPNVPAVGLGAKSILFGDFSRYWVRQVNGIRFEQSLDYAFNSDLITFKATWRADGALIDTTGAIKAFAGAAS